jgi:hypothetical protein
MNSSLILDVIATTTPTPTASGTVGEMKTVSTSTSTPAPKVNETVSVVISTGRGNRSLTTLEAVELANELGSKINNVVAQLVLTTHRNFHLLPLFTDCATATARKPRRKLRVLGLEYEHLPHLVRIGTMEEGGLVFSCAGTLISKRYVLTSAYCVSQKLPVTTALLEDEDGVKSYVGVNSIHMHGEFSNATMANDIALLRLGEGVQGVGTRIRPLCLPFEDAYGIWESVHQEPGSSATLAGWTKTTRSEEEKEKVDMDETTIRIISPQNCTDTFNAPISNKKQLCASPVVPTSIRSRPAYFTRGSPMTVTMTRHQLLFQIGLLSQYNDKAQLHTKLTEYLGWILDNLRE